MSPVGETLRARRSFPGMVNNTVIDWFVPWPEQALSPSRASSWRGGFARRDAQEIVSTW